LGRVCEGAGGGEISGLRGGLLEQGGICKCCKGGFINVAGGFLRDVSRGLSDSIIDLGDGDGEWGREGSAWTKNENDFTDHEDYVSVY
jgi:hypothetical protein